MTRGAALGRAFFLFMGWCPSDRSVPPHAFKGNDPGAWALGRPDTGIGTNFLQKDYGDAAPGAGYSVPPVSTAYTR